MGLLVDGKWHDIWYNTKDSDGRFERSIAAFRNWVTADGSAGVSGRDGFQAEKGRYHLYISYACPWAHRTMIMRALKGLQEYISFSVVGRKMLSNGWTFDESDGSSGDPLFASNFLHEIYTRAMPDYSGRVTVPVLWDKKLNTIVSNESSEIIRMLNSAFDGIGAVEGDYYPETLASEIDAVNTRIYDTFNNGVYRAGFATSQEAYEEAVYPLFETMDWMEGLLSDRRYIAGDALTEADIRLFPTLLRFDPVYHGHFKCNIRRVEDYPNLLGYTREIYQMSGIQETINLDHIKVHYYASHGTINPTAVVPVGVGADLSLPHGRVA